MIKKVFNIIIIMLLIVMMAACAAPAVDKPAVVPPSSSQPAPPSEPAAPSKPAVSSPDAAPSETSEIVVFNDEILEQRVREQMNKPEGDITIAEAQAVENLNVENKDNDPNGYIQDISALKYFTNLKTLYISLNNISDISPVAEMKNLEAFYSMNGNDKIADFTPLAGLKGMLDLSVLGNANINDSNIGFIKDMTSIEMIWFSNAPELTDISLMANFKNLTRLNVNNTGVSDISPAAGLIKLEAMDLSGSKVSNVKPLKGLVNLKRLYLKGCPIKDYSPLKDIYPNLEDKDFEIK